MTGPAPEHTHVRACMHACVCIDDDDDDTEEMASFARLNCGHSNCCNNKVITLRGSQTLSTHTHTHMHRCVFSHIRTCV